MEDNDGVAIPSQSEIPQDESSHMEDSEDSEFSKHSLVREQLYSNTEKSFSDSNTFRNFVGFSNINGDCATKNVGISEHGIEFRTASVHSAESSRGESSRQREDDSGSENGSKSSSSERSIGDRKYDLPKSEDSPHIPSVLSDSSSDSESSDSEDSFIDKEGEEILVSDPKNDKMLNVSPDRHNNFGDSEKEVSSDVLSEEKELKLNEEPVNTSELNSVNASSELSEKNNDESLSLGDVCNFKKELNPETESSDLSQPQTSSDPNDPISDNMNVNEVQNVTPSSSAVTVDSSVSNEVESSMSNEVESSISNEVESSISNEVESSMGNSVVDCEPKATEDMDVLAVEDKSENVSNIETNTEKTNMIKPDMVNINLAEPGEVKMNLDEQDNNLNNSASVSNINSIEKEPVNLKPKTEERVHVSELSQQFSIQYKGFKMTRTISGTNTDNKSLLKSNPFNPAWKRNSKSRFGMSGNFRDEIDCSTLQPEYAQYLGLQPIVKFKCSNCGMSTFQTMSALNTHQVECKKNGKLVSHNNELSHPPDMNSANIKLTRKVFLCSTCGTYYENCDLFLHMREFHRRYICLFCLFMAQSPDVLQEHLKEKHNIVNQIYMSLDELQKHSPQTFFLLCLRCDRVFTEMDDSANHKCTSKGSSDAEHGFIKRPRLENISLRLDSSNNQLSLPDVSKSKMSPAMTKEASFYHIPNEINLIEDRNKDSHNINASDKSRELNDDTPNSKFEKQDIAFDTENLQLKVPSGIEIKPLIPGDRVNYDKNEINENRSAIEIFPITSIETVKKKVKLIKKTKKIIKKTIKKKASSVKSKITEDNTIQNILPSPDIINMEVEPPSLLPDPQPMEQEPELVSKEEEETQPDNLPPETSLTSEVPEIKRSVSQEIFKIKLPGDIDSDGESDDSQKLSLVVDENTYNSDTDLRRNEIASENGDSSIKEMENQNNNEKDDSDEITLAREDVAAMALTLDDKIENVPIQAVVKECVRTSCLSCNYCRHACKIAVNGKQLALHLLSEHRYTPVKNETHDDVVRKLSNCLETLQSMYFNTETYDSSDTTIHIPYDQEKNFDCFQCSYVSTSHKDLYAHKRKCHTKSLLLCIMCKSNFYSYSELICHICPGSYNAKVQFHNVDLVFRCCFCRMDTIPSAFRLMVHLRKSHHTCDICLEMCSDQQKLSTHMWKHKLNHLCYRCGIAYASKPDITKHLFWKHGTESVLCKKCLQKKWPHVYHFCIPPTSFICEECNTSFSKAVALKVHKRIHGNDYPYSCEQCEKKFVSKKLLSRHIERHNAIALRKENNVDNVHEDKEEIINVTDLNDGKESSHNENSDMNREADGKDKGHRRHKKEKDKKKVVDLYNLPPLNLSSESDSSDEEESSKTLPPKEPKDENNIGSTSCQPIPENQDQNHDILKLDEGNESNSFDTLPPNNNGNSNVEIADNDPSKKDMEEHNYDSAEKLLKPSQSDPVSSFDTAIVNTLLPLNKEQTQVDETDATQNDHVEGIWENFYKTNPQNSKLPFPLCAMKSEVAYSIIMGDHDYCQQVKIDTAIKEDLPSVSTLVTSLSGDKLEEITPIIPEVPPQTPPPKEQETSSTPTSISKKKLKSPKKKTPKTPDDNNSSSSSDSSTDSDTTSCSCGTNCSCSSSSSNSSSSSSSDSDSSTNDDKNKQDKRKKRKDKRMKQKSESEMEAGKDAASKEPEPVTPIVPEDPPIRESELETDETTSDEEFYDRQPQIIANQMLAEKRQLVLLATGTPVNNGNASPTVAPPPPPAQEANISSPLTESTDTPKQKPKPKRKRKILTTTKIKSEKILSVQEPYSKFMNEPKPFSPFQQSIMTPKQKPQVPVPQSPSLPEAGGSGPETDNTRLSKRRRVPNKFYGYSSGEEEDMAPKQTPKWRKTEPPPSPIVQTPKIISHPHTPRIQLTVPKQVIRKPTYHKANMKAKQQMSSESSDSGASDIEERLPRPPVEEPIKADKDVYCYCRCPYDEVSEMIACDDANCKIEWFHFECVGILVPPRGQWFCPGCRKARGLPT